MGHTLHETAMAYQAWSISGANDGFWVFSLPFKPQGLLHISLSYLEWQPVNLSSSPAIKGWSLCLPAVASELIFCYYGLAQIFFLRRCLINVCTRAVLCQALSQRKPSCFTLFYHYCLLYHPPLWLSPSYWLSGNSLCSQMRVWSRAACLIPQHLPALALFSCLVY